MSCCKKQELGYGCSCKSWYNIIVSKKEFMFAMVCLVAYVILFIYLTNRVSLQIRSDVNKDGKVDMADVSVVVSNFTNSGSTQQK